MEINLTYNEGKYDYTNLQAWETKTDFIRIKSKIIYMHTSGIHFHLGTYNWIYNYSNTGYDKTLIINGKILNTSKFLEEARNLIRHSTDDEIIEKAKRLHMALRRIADGVTQEELDSISFSHTKSAKIN